MDKIVFSYGNQNQYDSIETKLDSQLYFILDTKRLYKGDVLVADSRSDSVSFETEIPDAASALPNKLYVVIQNSTASIYTKIGDELIAIGGGQSGDAFVDAVANRSKDNNNTVVTFTKASGGTKDITISDLFLSNADYDPATHELSLYVGDKPEPIKVDLSSLIPESIDASQVALARSIVATTDVGNVKKGDKIDVSSVENIQKLFEQILTKDSNPTVVQPSVAITLQSTGDKEVGTTYSPNYVASFNPGKYSDNSEGAQSTNVTASNWTVTDSNSNTSAESSGTFSSFTVLDDTDYYVSVSVQHTEGAVPTTYLGNEYPAGQIAAGTKSAVSTHIRSYRQGFYGALTSKSDEVTSQLIRTLTKTNKKVAKSQKYTISVPSGTMRIIVAYQSSVGDISSITSDEQFGSEIKDSFILSKVSVTDASGSNEIEYNVYTKDLASAQVNATKYQVTV